MKKITLFIFIFSTIGLIAQNVGINSTNATPDASAMLDVSSTNTGLLIPRVPLTGTTDITTITTAATSLLVYNTATITDVTPGYYYWNGTAWIRMLEGGTNDFWKTTGNAGTTAGTNFLGTTDAQDLVFKTNGTENMRVLNSNGNVGIGTSLPIAPLHLNKEIYANTSSVLDGALAVFNRPLLLNTTGTRASMLSLSIDDSSLARLGVHSTWSSGTLTSSYYFINSNPSELNAWGAPDVVVTDSGNVGIGVVNPGEKLQVHGGMTINSESAFPRRFGVWSTVENQGASGTSWTAGYLHLKTNITPSTMNLMFILHFLGFDYGNGSDVIDSYFSGYSYTVSNGIFTSKINNVLGTTNRVHINTWYLSSDNYLTIVLYSPSWYVTTVQLDVSTVGSTYINTINITNQSMRSTNANFY